MFSKVISGSLIGIESDMTIVEADLSNGIPSLVVVGLPDTTVKESKERIKAAITNSGFVFPRKKITINLSPAGMRKEGTHYDLAIAMSIMMAQGDVNSEKTKDFAMIGELSLNGRTNRINGALPIAIGLRKKGIKKMLVSSDNAEEIAVLKDIKVYAVNCLRDAVSFMNDEILLPLAKPLELKYAMNQCRENEELDFSQIAGQFEAKRGLQIAAAGSHNLLMSGPPGCGKTMLARCILSILPEMTYEEMLEATKIFSVAGRLTQKMPFITQRQFRSPHHTIGAPGLIGGGQVPRPGEVSLAHYGVLFLDEVSEFSVATLNLLRQPIEDEMVTISRVNQTICFPSKFLMICSENPCPCGNYGSVLKECTCSSWQIERHRNQVCGPFLDRIDLRLDLQPIKYEELNTNICGRTSQKLKEEVVKAREMQMNRFSKKDILYNAQMTSKMVKEFCHLDKKTEQMVRDAYEKMGLTARAYHRILKVSRTIADLEGKRNIEFHHVAEAIQYRGRRHEK